MNKSCLLISLLLFSALGPLASAQESDAEAAALAKKVCSAEFELARSIEACSKTTTEKFLAHAREVEAKIEDRCEGQDMTVGKGSALFEECLKRRGVSEKILLRCANPPIAGVRELQVVHVLDTIPPYQDTPAWTDYSQINLVMANRKTLPHVGLTGTLDTTWAKPEDHPVRSAIYGLYNPNLNARSKVRTLINVGISPLTRSWAYQIDYEKQNDVEISKAAPSRVIPANCTETNGN